MAGTGDPATSRRCSSGTASSRGTGYHRACSCSRLDWLSERFFHHAGQDAHIIPALDMHVYHQNAQMQAAQALQALGWLGWTPPADPATFTQLFPGLSPRPLQQAVIAVASRLGCPVMVKVGMAAREELARLYQQAMAEMQQEDFCAVWTLLTVWGCRGSRPNRGWVRG
jgi:hypothetical protein